MADYYILVGVCVCSGVEIRLYGEVLCFLFHLNWMHEWALCGAAAQLIQVGKLCFTRFGSASEHWVTPPHAQAFLFSYGHIAWWCCRPPARQSEWSPCVYVCVLVPLEWQPWSGSLVPLPAAEWGGEHLGNQQQKAFSQPSVFPDLLLGLPAHQNASPIQICNCQTQGMLFLLLTAGACERSVAFLCVLNLAVSWIVLFCTESPWVI